MAPLPLIAGALPEGMLLVSPVAGGVVVVDGAVVDGDVAGGVIGAGVVVSSAFWPQAPKASNADRAMATVARGLIWMFCM